MARISDDDSSWKAEGLKKKFDDWEHKLRNHPGKKKKNTKKWCKGVVGREHDLIIGHPDHRFTFAVNNTPRYIVDKCKKCGKEFNWRWNPKLPKPNWWS